MTAYEIVEIEAKMTAGIKAVTSNSDKEMKSIIGNLWEKFFKSGIFESIPCKTGSSVYGLYTNYQNGVNGKYDAVVSCGVQNCKDLPQGLTAVEIPAGKYARFTAPGEPAEAVRKAWSEIRKTPLNRKFICDFEEYTGNGQIYIYIGIC